MISIFRKTLLATCFIFSIFYSTQAQVTSKPKPLLEDDVKHFIKAQKEIKKYSDSEKEYMKTFKYKEEPNSPVYTKLAKTLEGVGFKDFYDYQFISAKVVTAYEMSKSDKPENFETDMEKKIRAKLKDEKLEEKDKIKLLKILNSLKESRPSKQDVELVSKYKKELDKLFKKD